MADKMPYMPDHFMVAFSIFLNRQVSEKNSKLRLVFTHQESNVTIYDESVDVDAYPSVAATEVVKLKAAIDLSGCIMFSEPGFYTYRLLINDIAIARNELRVR